MGSSSWRTKPLPPGWEGIRARILKRDRYLCRLRYDRCEGFAVEVDHVRPASQGGGDEDANLIAVCGRCHRTKTARESHFNRPRRKRTPEAHPGRTPDALP